jgi:hypothetical protein
MACGNSDPDVETIRSFLDKGAYVNWRDLQGRTAFDLVLYSQQRHQQKMQASSSASLETTNNQMLDTTILMNNNSSSNTGLDDSFRSNNNVDNENDSEDGSIDDEDIITRGSSINSTPPKSFKAFGKSTFTSSNRFSLGSSASTLYNKKPDDSIIDSTRRRSSGSIFTNNATATTTTSTFNQGDNTSSSCNNNNYKQQKWRAMENTIKQVGDWAVKALPALLEISKRGGRYRPQQDSLLSTLRPSFRAAIEEAQGVWRKAQQPPNFVEFVQVREQSGEDLLLHKSNWTKDKISSICQLCSEGFSLRVRRHHCRSCGVLTCDDCSSKRLILSSNLDGDNNNEYLSENNNSKKIKSEEKTAIISQYQRVCDGCFSRLCFEASQPSPDHFRVKQLKSCALDVIASMEGLVQALDSLDSTSATRSIINNFNKDFEQMMSIGGDTNTKRTSISNLITPEKSTRVNQLQSHKSLTTTASTSGTTGATSVPSNINTQYDEVLLEVLKSRELKVKHAEDIVAKFLEVS